MDGVSSVIHQPVSSVSPLDSPTHRPILNHTARINNPFQAVSPVRQSISSPSFADPSLSAAMRQPFQNAPLANEHTNGIPANVCRVSASVPQNGSPKQLVQSGNQSPTHPPSDPATDASKVTADARPSAIPRLMPSVIPRLNTQLSAPVTCNSVNGAAPKAVSQIQHPTPEPRAKNSDSSDLGQDRSRILSRPSLTARVERSTSEHPQRFGDNESDTSSVFSSSGAPRRITSKINSLKNVQHKPGGGNVTIVDEKVKLGPITSKCNSLANVKHKPGGGNVQIVDVKIDTSAVQPKVNSLKNVKHTPAGGNVQIVSEKLEFDKKAKSKVGSLKNARYHPGGGDVKIYNEALPWLKYNRPNLPAEEKARINKHRSMTRGDMTSSVHSTTSTTALTSNSGAGM